MSDPPPRLRRRILHAVRAAIIWVDRRVPLGVRSLLGLVVAVAGLFGFLPVLGFWMIPTGLALIALDIPPWRRWLMKRIGRKAAHADASPRTNRDAR